MTVRSRHLTLAALLLLAWGCDSPTDPIRLFAPAMTLEAIGDSKQLEANITGSDALPEWESLTPEILSVTRAGMVTALASGTGRVRARLAGETAEATVTVLPPVDVQIVSATRTIPETGPAQVNLRLRNSAGRGFYRMEFWQARASENEEHRVVLRYITDSEAPAGMDVMVSNSLSGMENVDWVLVHSRQPHELGYRSTACLRLDGGSPCPLP
jgi:hypothetical protein